MRGSELQRLLDAVRLRLWRGRFIAALRGSLWGSAAMLALAIAVALLAGRSSVPALAAALAGLWLLMLAWAAWRRPTDRACALWADRHLGGASAFSTLLELDRGDRPEPDPAALRGLQRWAANKVPECLDALAERPDPARMARPLFSALVCAALATLVLGLLDPMPAAPQAAAPLPAGEPAAAEATPSAGGELAKQIAQAVRAAESRQAAERRGEGQAPAAAKGRPSADQAPADQVAAKPAGAQRGDSAAASAASLHSVAAARTDPGNSSAAASGRDAGDSPDPRAGGGMSRASQGTIAAQERALKAGRRPGEMQAAMDQQGSYDEVPAKAAASVSHEALAAVAATPPTASGSTALTATETSYVQAWMKASARPR